MKRNDEIYSIFHVNNKSQSIQWTLSQFLIHFKVFIVDSSIYDVLSNIISDLFLIGYLPSLWLRGLIAIVIVYYCLFIIVYLLLFIYHYYFFIYLFIMYPRVLSFTILLFTSVTATRSMIRTGWQTFWRGCTTAGCWLSFHLFFHLQGWWFFVLPVTRTI